MFHLEFVARQETVKLKNGKTLNFITVPIQYHLTIESDITDGDCKGLNARVDFSLFINKLRSEDDFLRYINQFIQSRFIRYQIRDGRIEIKDGFGDRTHIAGSVT